MPVSFYSLSHLCAPTPAFPTSKWHIINLFRESIKLNGPEHEPSEKQQLHPVLLSTRCLGASVPVCRPFRCRRINNILHTHSKSGSLILFYCSDDSHRSLARSLPSLVPPLAARVSCSLSQITENVLYAHSRYT